MMTTMRRPLLPVLGWLLTMLAATTVGLLAVSLISAEFTDSATPLTSDAVAEGLASTTPPKASDAPDSRPSPSSRPTPPSGPTPTAHSLRTPGGTLIARCTDQQVYLVSWTPAQGWQVDEHDRGPAPSARVQFEHDGDSDTDREVTTTITCRSGRPVASTVDTDD